MKICSKCGRGYPATNDYFYWNNKAEQSLKAECKRCTAKRRKKYREKNKEALAFSKKEYYEKNKETILEYAKKYSLDNKEARAEQAKQYRQEHAEEYHILWHSRNARIHKLPHTLTILQWGEAKEYFDGKCSYCGRKLPLTQDHWIPVTKDGNYSKENIVPACKSCNSSKRNQDAIEWFSKQTFYSEIRQVKILEYLGFTNSVTQLSIG
jgi:5-methylcytosine-specific restriction endonuclease McrA